MAQIQRHHGGNLKFDVQVDTGVGPESGGLYDVAEYDVDVYGGTEADWLTLTELVEYVDCGYGVHRHGERFPPGQATIVLNNRDGRFTSEALVDETGESQEHFWHLPFRPGRKIRVVARPHPDDDTIKKVLWIGTIDDSTDDMGDGVVPTTQVDAYDHLALFASYNPLALSSATGQQSTDERVESALDRMGWTVYELQPGYHDVQTSFLAQSVLEECSTAADAEGSAFFVDGEGTAQFKNRDWLTTDTRSVEIQGVIGQDVTTYENVGLGGASVIPLGASVTYFPNYETPIANWSKGRIKNHVAFARKGGTLQVAEDSLSQSSYGLLTYERTDFENVDDASVLLLAERYLAYNKDNKYRLEAITIDGTPDPDDDDLNRLMYDAEIGDLIHVKIWGTDQEWFYHKLVNIVGIRYHLDSERWEVTFALDDSPLTLES